MSEVQVLKPLKTWSHLAGRRRKPSEYEIVSANLLYNTRDPNAPYELSPDMFMNRWYKEHRDGSPFKHPDWNAFRDPDELVYRTYNMLQDGQEAYVYGLFNQFNDREHDKSLDAGWARTLARLYTPSRYLYHTLQMVSAYLQQMSPASTITNCAAFQAADFAAVAEPYRLPHEGAVPYIPRPRLRQGRAQILGGRRSLAGLPGAYGKTADGLGLGRMLRGAQSRRQTRGGGGDIAHSGEVGAA